MKKDFLANLLMAFAIVAQGQIPNGFYNAASGLSCQNLKTVLKILLIPMLHNFPILPVFGMHINILI